MSLLIGYALCVLLLATGCSSTQNSISYSKSELQLIPYISLKRIASNHAPDEIVAIRINGRDAPVEVKEFENRDYVTIYTDHGKEERIRFYDITELLIFRNTKKPQQTESQKGTSASAVASATIETSAYMPIVPLAIGTWPLLKLMGLDASNNNEDNRKAWIIYRGMSKKDLLESIGEPKEKYSCILKLHLKDKPDVPQEIWVYDDNKVLRGGRALSIDIETGTVSHNSFHTSYFKDSNSFTCSPLVEP